MDLCRSVIFRPVSRCPKCGGDATSRIHQPGLHCGRMSGSHVHRRCEDCGFSWAEKLGERRPPVLEGAGAARISA
jgi:hypothetical protein